MMHSQKSIAGMMILVAFVAVNCAILKGIKTLPDVWNELVILGGIPMANLLAIGLLPCLRRRPNHSRVDGFRVGFEICGAIAMVAFLALSFQFPVFFFHLPQTCFHPYVTHGFSYLGAAFFLFLASQLSIAVLGGYLGRLILGRNDTHSAPVRVRGSSSFRGWPTSESPGSGG